MPDYRPFRALCVKKSGELIITRIPNCFIFVHYQVNKVQWFYPLSKTVRIMPVIFILFTPSKRILLVANINVSNHITIYYLSSTLIDPKPPTIIHVSANNSVLIKTAQREHVHINEK
jgi:hypothetical protein